MTENVFLSAQLLREVALGRREWEITLAAVVHVLRACGRRRGRDRPIARTRGCGTTQLLLIILELHQVVSVAVTCGRRHTVPIVSLLGRLRLLQTRWNVSIRFGFADALTTGARRGIANILHARASNTRGAQVARRLLRVTARVTALAGVGVSSVMTIVVAAGPRFIATAHSTLFNVETAHGIGQAARGS